jgi:hypothetical protein
VNGGGSDDRVRDFDFAMLPDVDGQSSHGVVQRDFPQTAQQLVRFANFSGDCG